MKKVAKGLVSAFKEAGTSWNKIAGIPEPRIKLYDKLTDQHFDILRNTYGTERTAAYIKAMEAKKMGVK